MGSCRYLRPVQRWGAVRYCDDGSPGGPGRRNFWLFPPADNLADLTAKAYTAIGNDRQRSVDILVGRSTRFEKMKLLPTVENEVYRKGVLLPEILAIARAVGSRFFIVHIHPHQITISHSELYPVPADPVPQKYSPQDTQRQ